MRSSSEEEILVFRGAYAATVMNRVVLVLIDRNSMLKDAGCEMFSGGILFRIAILTQSILLTLSLNLLVLDVESFLVCV